MTAGKSETAAIDVGFVRPTKNALAQAMCLVDCAGIRWSGCTFDGHSCDDRHGYGYERRAQEALKDV